jgi:uncharacterized protein (DUF433 family)
MPQLPVIAEHIEITPGTCGGKPRIAGHRIKVQDIVIWHERMGMSPDEIVSNYPSITLSDVYAALAYYPSSVTLRKLLSFLNFATLVY